MKHLLPILWTLSVGFILCYFVQKRSHDQTTQQIQYDSVMKELRQTTECLDSLTKAYKDFNRQLAHDTFLFSPTVDTMYAPASDKLHWQTEHLNKMLKPHQYERN